MRLRIVGWLSRMINALINADKRLKTVREIVAMAEALQSSDKSKIDGQRKRSWALNQLIAKFPNSKVRDLSFLIERVIQEG